MVLTAVFLAAACRIRPLAKARRGLKPVVARPETALTGRSGTVAVLEALSVFRIIFLPVAAGIAAAAITVAARRIAFLSCRTRIAAEPGAVAATIAGPVPETAATSFVPIAFTRRKEAITAISAFISHFTFLKEFFVHIVIYLFFMHTEIVPVPYVQIPV